MGSSWNSVLVRPLLIDLALQAAARVAKDCEKVPSLVFPVFESSDPRVNLASCEITKNMNKPATLTDQIESTRGDLNFIPSPESELARRLSDTDANATAVNVWYSDSLGESGFHVFERGELTDSEDSAQTHIDESHLGLEPSEIDSTWQAPIERILSRLGVPGPADVDRLFELFYSADSPSRSYRLSEDGVLLQSPTLIEPTSQRHEPKGDRTSKRVLDLIGKIVNWGVRALMGALLLFIVFALGYIGWQFLLLWLP